MRLSDMRDMRFQGMGMGRGKKQTPAAVKMVRLIVLNAALACLLMLVSTFVPRWRAQGEGTTSFLLTTGWTGESIGLFNVLRAGAKSASWSDLKSVNCMEEDAGWFWEGEQPLEALLNSANSPCMPLTANADMQACKQFHLAMQRTRCTSYTSIISVNTTLTVLSSLLIFVAGVTTLCGLSSNMSKYGRRVAAVWAGAGSFGVILSLVWLLVTTSAYQDIVSTQAFPWPKLAICWYLYLYGCLTLIVSGAMLLLLSEDLRKNFSPAKGRMDRIARMLEMRRPQPDLAEHSTPGPVLPMYMGGMPVPQPQPQPARIGMGGDFGITAAPQPLGAAQPMGGMPLASPGPMMAAPHEMPSLHLGGVAPTPMPMPMGAPGPQPLGMAAPMAVGSPPQMVSLNPAVVSPPQMASPSPMISLAPIVSPPVAPRSLPMVSMPGATTQAMPPLRSADRVAVPEPAFAAGTDSFGRPVPMTSPSAVRSMPLMTTMNQGNEVGLQTTILSNSGAVGRPRAF